MVFLGIFIVLVYGHILLQKIQKGSKNIYTLNHLEKISILLLLASTISLSLNFSIHGLGLLIALFWEPIILFIGIKLSGTKLNQKIILYGIASLLIINGLLCMIQYYSLWLLPQAYWGNAIEPKRSLGIFSHPNANALFITPLLALLLPFIWQTWRQNHEKFKKIFLTLGLLFGSLGLLFSMSRAGYLALTVAASIFLFQKLSKLQLVCTFIIGVVAIIGLVNFLPIVKYRLTHAAFKDNASSARLELWKGGVNLLKQNPVFGVGLGGFSREYAKLNIDPIYGTHTSPHNIFLHFWLETGLLGLLSISSIFIFLIWQGFFQKSVTLNQKALGLFVMAIIIHGLFDIAYFKNDLALTFWLILATFGQNE
jgi:O-antigen polymerase